MFTFILLISFFVNAEQSSLFEANKEPVCQSDSCIKKFEKVLKYAGYGNPTAQLMVAIAYLNGEGVEKNSAKGISWLKKAKAQGSTKALWMLSQLYREGTLIEQDLTKANYLLKVAVDRNFPPALFEKAVMTLDFDNQDNSAEIDLLKRSKDSGYKPAEYLFAKMLKHGIGVKKDMYESAKLFRELGQYRDSQEHYDTIRKNAKKNFTAQEQLKFQHLEDIEVIEVAYNGAGYDSFLDNMITLFKNEDSVYDKYGGFSRISSKKCTHSNGCGYITGEELRNLLRRR